MITAIAGVNGAGKSSVAGAYIRDAGGEYFNPDEVARELMNENSQLTTTEANSEAWKTGFEQLTRAIKEGKDYIFETTLGGTSIPELLHQAIENGQQVRIYFCGLNSPDLHIQRVKERVTKGGHNIPEDKIRQRWKNSIHNLMGLIPICAETRVIDNSSPERKHGPEPVCLFHIQDDCFIEPPTDPMPTWAKPIAAEAIKRVPV